MNEALPGDQPQQLPKDDIITIMGVVGIRRLDYLYPNGEAVADSTTILSESTFKNTLRTLSRIARSMEPGEYPKDEVRRASGMTRQFMGSLLVRLETTAPEGILSVTENETVQVGSFLVDARQATEDEVTAYKAQEKARKSAALEAHKQELLAAEQQKTHLSTHDHALITIDEGTTYQVGLEHWDELLLTRAMMHLNTDYDSLSIQHLARKLWKNMPLAERALFVKTEDQVYSDSINSPKHLEKRLEILFDTVTSQIGVTRRQTMPGSFGIKARSIRVELQSDPEITDPTALPLLPPRKSIEAIAQELTPDELLQANSVMERIGRGTISGLEHDDCIAMLDTLTSNRGKLALAKALAERSATEKLQEVLTAGHDIVRRRLGTGVYWDTYRNRMIGGNTRRGKARQVSGGTQHQSTTKWWVGTPKDPKGSVAPN